MTSIHNNLSTLQSGQMANINVTGRWLPAMFIRRLNSRYQLCTGENNTNVTGNQVRILNQNELSENQIYIRDRCRVIVPSPSSSSSSDEEPVPRSSAQSRRVPRSSLRSRIRQQYSPDSENENNAQGRKKKQQTKRKKRRSSRRRFRSK